MKKSIFVFINIIVFAVSTLNPQTWSLTKRLTWNPGVSYLPSIAAESNNGIHVAWSDDSPGNFEIFYKSSTDGGTTWSSLIRLTWNIGKSYYPCTSTDSDKKIFVVWEDISPGNSEIFFKCSTDRGVNWSAVRRITWNSGESRKPSIAVDQAGGIHVVWEDDSPGNFEIFYKNSTDDGATWSSLKRLTWNTGNSLYPSIAADPSNGIHVAWEDGSPQEDSEILYKCSTDNGITWSTVKRLTWNSGTSNEPSVTADSSNGIHISWNDDTPGNQDIFYKRSTDSGVTWSGLKRVSWNAGNSIWSSIVSDTSNGIHIVWTDYSSPGDSEIFYKHSTDSGTTWSALKRLTWNGDSYENSIAADSSSGIHVAWGDSSPGNEEIFYKNRK